MQTQKENVGDVAALIPQSWDLGAETQADLLFLGSEFIKRLIEYWGNQADELAKEIIEIEKSLRDCEQDQQTVNKHTRTRTMFLKHKGKIDDKIKKLVTLGKVAERKPLLPRFRPYNWFHSGSKAICYIGNLPERVAPSAFVGAVIIDGYRYNNGIVSVRYDARVYSGDDHAGGGYHAQYGLLRPEIMYEWEFEYLRAHRDFANLWLKEGVSEYLSEFEPEKFLDDLACYKDT